MVGTASDVFKQVIYVKIVPDNDPDADGEWVTMAVHEKYLRPKTHWGYLSSIAPPGHHAVATRV